MPSSTKEKNRKYFRDWYHRMTDEEKKIHNQYRYQKYKTKQSQYAKERYKKLRNI